MNERGVEADFSWTSPDRRPVGGLPVVVRVESGKCASGRGGGRTAGWLAACSLSRRKEISQGINPSLGSNPDKCSDASV